MGFFRKQLLKVIEWEDSTPDTMVYKFPMDAKAEIMTGSRLTVRPSQAVVFVNRGQVADVFPPGEYRLTTRNLPILTKLGSWKFGFDSPFQAEVYFINTKQFIDQKWGTKNPIMMRDADFGMIRLRGFGKFSFRVDDPAKFLNEIFGTTDRYKVGALSGWLATNLISGITDRIGESKISALDLAANYMEFGEDMLHVMEPKFKAMGLELGSFVIENLSLPEEVEKAMDKRTSVGVMKGAMGDYTQYESVQAMRDAAKNPSSGGFAGAGMGFGMGNAFGQMMTGAMANASSSPSASEQKQTCPACGMQIRAGVKFCPECGASASPKSCPKCGITVKANAKFCPECGCNLGDAACPKCGEKVAAGVKFCPHCGEKI